MDNEIRAISDDMLPIMTERLVLRRFAQHDYGAYAAYHCRADVYRFLYCAPPVGAQLEQQFAQALASRLSEDGDAFHFAVARREDGAVLGEALLKLANKKALQAEVGYIFNPAFSGKGYATEAVAAVVDLGFKELGCHRIYARLDALNLGSIGIVERLGFRREAHLIENDRFNGLWGDEFIYAALRREWEERQAPR